MPTRPRRPDPFDTAADVEVGFLNPAGAVEVVARDDTSQPIGFLRIVKTPSTGKFNVSDVYVAPDHRSRGIGSDMARTAADALDIGPADVSSPAATADGAALFEKVIGQPLDRDTGLVDDYDGTERLAEIRAADAEPTVDDLRDRLLGIGGDSAVIPPFEEDLDKIIERGILVDGPADRHVEGDPSQCHANAAALYEQHGGSIITGYALSSDGGWRQHSWWMSPEGDLVETTEPRTAYCGFVLDAGEADEFRFDNW